MRTLSNCRASFLNPIGWRACGNYGRAARQPSGRSSWSASAERSCIDDGATQNRRKGRHETRERELAKERERVRKGKQPGAKSGKLPHLGDTRDAVGAGVGMSGKTYERAKAVTKAAKANPQKYGKFAAATPDTRCRKPLTGLGSTRRLCPVS